MGGKKTEQVKKNILVTGGGGFLGKAIIRLLLEDGHAITSFSRTQYKALAEMGVRQICGDIADLDAVKNAVQGHNVVFHTAAKAGVWGSFQTYFSTNVTGTKNILAACRHCDTPMLIHTSSPSVVFDGTDMEGVDESASYPAHYHAPYPETKAMAEQEVIAAAKEGLNIIILRPHLIWGPGDTHLVPRILERANSLRRVGNGGNTVDTIYIDNAARAHVLAMEALERDPTLSGRIYFISDDAPIRLWKMVDMLLASGGKPPLTRSISPKAAFFIGTALEWIYRALHLSGEPKMTRFVAKELATSHWFDISSAKNDLGYTAEVSIEEGMKRLQKWLNGRRLESSV
jgi:nucleoside-diphosphate-sugar epimerase